MSGNRWQRDAGQGIHFSAEKRIQNRSGLRSGASHAREEVAAPAATHSGGSFPAPRTPDASGQGQRQWYTVRAGATPARRMPYDAPQLDSSTWRNPRE
jgi:hypothetical protein